MKKMAKYKYYLNNRPVDIGTVPRPKEIIKSENWIPSKNNGYLYGFVVYNSKLSFQEIFRYELIPHDTVEWAKYMFWEKSDKDPIQAKKFMNMYRALSLSELESWKDRDPFAKYMLIIKKNKI